MLGAIIGDIVGSPFEFDRRKKLAQTNFKFFLPTAHYTDDSVMTVAIAEAILKYKADLPDEIKENVLARYCQASMIRWGRKYPLAGYGGHFMQWIWARNPQPYNSCGNGSGMRVSPAGFLYDDLEDVLTAAKATALPSHNHPEGIKGAQAIAYMIWAARNEKSKKEMKTEAEKRFGYDLNFTLDEIRPTYRMYETCQMTVPQAIVAFLEGNSFEDCIRKAISIGGDADTIACMTGGIAEAYYDIPLEIRDEGMKRIPNDMLHVIWGATLRDLEDVIQDQP